MKFHDFVLVNTDFFVNEKAYIIDMEYNLDISKTHDRQTSKYLVQFYNYDYRKWIDEQHLTKVEK
jgi:hypothetical protein